MADNDMENAWKEYFEDLHNVDTEEWVAVNTCVFDGGRGGNYFGGGPVRRTEAEVRVQNLYIVKRKVRMRLQEK